MRAPAVSIWKKAPFIRLLLSLGVGIILQWNFIIPVIFHWLILLVGSLITLLFFWLPVFKRFKLGYLMGVAVCLVFVSIGSLLIAYNDIRYQKDWFNNHYRGNEFLLLKLEEPLVEKPRSFKAVASVLSLFNLQKTLKVRGRIIVYFSKDSVPHKFGYGSLLLIRKPLQEIRSSGNPGAFDFKRFALFQGITHQVYLMPGEFIRPDSSRKSILKEFIFDTRRMILNILKKNIRGKKELGLAEALLIGYKDDLDKTLLQSYSNTGVVHVIAISGLHLGLIYWLLLRLCQPLLGNRKTRWLNPTIIITGLWLFTLIAGAQPSVLRSAIMFTCLVLGNSFTRKSTAINSLAFSAFLLLCINPFWLFDIGFQLSYAAVLSLIIFMRPVYNLFYIRQKIIDYIWQMNAVTLAAQLITLPFSIYYFHQFPNFFLLTNLIAVPLSSLVLLVEIGLCLFHWLPGLASFIGELLGKMIGWMNFFIEWMEKIPFSLWDGLQITIVQMFLMLVFLAGLHNWFVEKSKPGLKLALWALLGFAGLRLVSFCEASQQQKIIVYNLPKKAAIDFIEGRSYWFLGDSSLVAGNFEHDFHLKPSRILHRVQHHRANEELIGDFYLVFKSIHMLILDSSIGYDLLTGPIQADILILTGNPKIKSSTLVNQFKVRQVVIDGSVSSRRAARWKTEFDSLGIPCHDVTMQGAFVKNIP